MLCIPSLPAPDTTFETIGHGPIDPVGKPAPNGTLITFFPHAQCKASRFHLKALDDMIGDFAIRGVMLLAASADSAASLLAMTLEMQIARLPIAHSLDPARMREHWGVLLSQGDVDVGEPPVFTAPAHFWVRNDGSVGLSGVYSTPLMLPEIKSLLRGVEKCAPKGKAPHGSYINYN
jgi:hypothetical protein